VFTTRGPHTDLFITETSWAALTSNAATALRSHQRHTSSKIRIVWGLLSGIVVELPQLGSSLLLLLLRSTCACCCKGHCLYVSLVQLLLSLLLLLVPHVQQVSLVKGCTHIERGGGRMHSAIGLPQSFGGPQT
jgi:hypothetical protein